MVWFKIDAVTTNTIIETFIFNKIKKIIQPENKFYHIFSKK